MRRFIWVFGLIFTIFFALSIFGTVNASTNDFTISRFEADYYLDLDGEGRSILETTEKIVAEFPNFDQNHGIERALVTTYDGHSTGLNIKSIKNQLGQDYQYSTNWQSDNLVLRIGDAESYVHGTTTYDIEYSQRDVTRFFSDTGSDEFYWDVNGTQWYQEFSNVTARIHLSDSLINKLNNKASCYVGKAGSEATCNLSDVQNGVLTASVDNLAVGENVTIAVGFNPGTFEPYKMDMIGFIDTYMALISLGICLAGLGVVLILWAIKGRNAPGRGIIIAEYLPPRDADAVMSSVIKSSPKTWVSAVIIDLAVRHNIKIIEKNKKQYCIEYQNQDGLTENEKGVIQSFFGDNPSSKQLYEIDNKKPDNKLAAKLASVYRKTKASLKNDGYYRNVNKLKLVIGIIVTLALIQSIIVLVIAKPGITVLADILPFISILIAMLGYGAIGLINPLSNKGRELADYLDGLKKYIKVAEEDRIKILQSPEGAEKTPVDTNDAVVMLHLYERVLPYAVLFGLEKNWTKLIGEYYEKQGEDPDWYVGNSAFNAVMFSSVMSDFSGSVKTNSYYASSSSLSGGSGGGGFSGGGGGGGGGGGW